MGRPPWARWKGKRKDPQTVGLRHGFRSGLEKDNADHLTKHGIPVVFEQVRIKYPIPATMHTYTPDFLLPNGVIVETKGRFMPIDRAKHLYIQLSHPTLDVRFIFQNPNARLNPNSKTTYAMWAEMHKFKWAKKLVPIEWAKEPSTGGPTGPGVIQVPEASADLFPNVRRVGSGRPTLSRMQGMRPPTPQARKASGLPRGVYPSLEKFQARSTQDGKNHYIGTYDTKEEASAAHTKWCKDNLRPVRFTEEG